MPDTVEISTVAEALEWGDAWRIAYERLLRLAQDAQLDLETERVLAEVEPIVIEGANREAREAALLDNGRD